MSWVDFVIFILLPAGLICVGILDTIYSKKPRG